MAQIASQVHSAPSLAHGSDSISSVGLKTDSLGGVLQSADSIAADSLRGEEHYGILLTPPPRLQSEARPSTPLSTPWLGLAVLVLFGLFCLRLKSSFRFLGSLFHELTSARIRENMFDETVHETTFLVLLNLICAITSGVILYDIVGFFNPSLVENPLALWGCVAVAGVYCAVMPMIYWVTGLIFSDRERAGIWLRGFVASQSLLGLALLLPALVSIYYPESLRIILILALILILATKFAFISKSFRIFLRESTSLLLFLYYLCSVEIVPLILVYAGGMAICSLIAA